MFSKLSEVSSTKLTSFLLLSAGLHQASALTVDSSITHADDLSCNQCILGGHKYSYLDGLWADGAGAPTNTPACTSSNGIDGPSLSIAEGLITDSTDFGSKEYAMNACPQDESVCGERSIHLFQLDDSAVTRTISAGDLAADTACHYTFIAECGVPVVEIKSAASMTKHKLEFVEMALDLTAATASLASGTQPEPLAPNGCYAPIDTVFEFDSDNLAADEGTLGAFQSTTVAAQVAKVEADNEKVAKYYRDINAYYTATETYASSWVAVLKENYDDYMNKVREEGDELKKTLVGTAPAYPATPESDDFTAATILSSTDMQYAGNPWGGEIDIDTSKPKKSFGVLGQGSSDNQGFDFDFDSFSSKFGESDSILGVLENKDAVAESLEYFPKVCRPKMIFLNLYRATADAVGPYEGAISLEFSAQEPQATPAIIRNQIPLSFDSSFFNLAEPFTVYGAAKSAATSHSSYYESNGATMVGSIAATTAALFVASTLI